MTHHAMKITAIGNSVGVILNKELLAKFNVGKGDMLFATETPEGIMLRVYDADFAHAMGLAEQIMRDHRDVLKRLAE